MRMTKSTDHLGSGFTKLIQLSFLVLKIMMIQMHMNQHLTCAFVSSYSLQKIADLCTSSKYMSILEPSYTSDPHGNNNNSNNSKETKDNNNNKTSISSFRKTSRRDLLSKSLATTISISLPTLINTPTSYATDIKPIHLTSSWTATSGLNTLDPSENSNFVAFDPSAYQAMRDDPSRTPFFQQALKDLISQKKQQQQDSQEIVVLDLGTGPFALFAIMAAEMGADKVYAIEANKQAANNARQLIQSKGLSNTITILDGFSTNVSLPSDIKADIIIAEIVGSIASEESAYATILDAHERFAKYPNDPNTWIPNRIQTWAAPASYTLHNLFVPPEFDWSKIANEPVRFNCRDYGLMLLTYPQCVEDIVFSDIVQMEEKRLKRSTSTLSLSYTISQERIDDNTLTFYDEYRKGRLPNSQASTLSFNAARSFTGLAFWPRLLLPGKNGAETYVINSRKHPSGDQQRSHWQTVLPVMNSIPVGGLKGGDRIEALIDFDTPVTVTKAPKYSVSVDVYPSG